MGARTYQLLSPQIVSRTGGALVTLRPLLTGAGSLAFDSTWSPYVQGTINCAPPTAAELSLIDPRQGVRLTATVRQIDSDGTVVSRPINLQVRARARTYARGAESLVLTVTSDEALAQDWASETGLGPTAADTASNFITYALSKVFDTAGSMGTYTIESGAPNGNLASASTWDPGTDAWSYMAAMAEAAGGWLICDELRNWHYAPPTWCLEPASVTWTDRTHIIDVADTVDRANPAFGNYALVKYTDGMVSSNGGVSPRRTISVDRNRKQPAGNAATKIRTAAQKRGRTLIVNALAEIATRPNQPRVVTYQGVSWSTIVENVTLDLSTGLMQLRLNVIE